MQRLGNGPIFALSFAFNTQFNVLALQFDARHGPQARTRRASIAEPNIAPFTVL